MDLKESIINILSEHFPETGHVMLEYGDLINDLGMDSICFISLVIELETAFNLQIPDDYLLLEKFRNLTMISEMITKILSGEHERKSDEK